MSWHIVGILHPQCLWSEIILEVLRNRQMNFMIFALLGHKMKNRKSSSPYGRGITLNILILFNKKRASRMWWERQAHMAESHRAQDTLYYMECFCTTDVHTDVVIDRDN